MTRQPLCTQQISLGNGQFSVLMSLYLGDYDAVWLPWKPQGRKFRSVLKDYHEHRRAFLTEAAVLCGYRILFVSDDGQLEIYTDEVAP